MSIFVNSHTKLLVQGITGQEGQFHTRQCISYGTNVVAGVTPGKGGQFMDKVPVFNTVADAREATGANASMIFVPPPFAADAILEAADAGIEMIVCITEGIPVMDMLRVKNYLALKPSIRLIGPNCPGIITPGQCKIGIMPAPIHTPGGPVGVVRITSYSVCYTKLLRIVWSAAMWVTAKPRSRCAPPSRPCWMASRLPRITSYNVCYTKLLRPGV